MVKEWVWQDIWSKGRGLRVLLKSACLGSGCPCDVLAGLYWKGDPVVVNSSVTEHVVIEYGSLPIEVAYTYR